METTRKPFQGVGNIVRFNWHFYAIASASISFLLLASFYLNPHFQYFIYFICFSTFATTSISLVVSWYVYDLSGLYQFKWIASENTSIAIININAGFDETSELLKAKFPKANLQVLDFYDPSQHTEVSIRRARKAYPPYPTTQTTSTEALPIASHSADAVFVIFAAHEIRDEKERILFFKELGRIIKPNKKIYLTEHLRDLPNFLAYNIGFFHFYSKKNWLEIFEKANIRLEEEIKPNHFISTFILSKHGDTF
jgi:SAM-dependent methyltransferase